MKHFFIGTLVALMLVMVLNVGAFATAESAAPEVPAAADDTALLDALNAYRAARRGDRYGTLEEELKEYVEAGKLTQEQADLILKNFEERQALCDGNCPNCGAQFRGGYGMGRGGRSNGGKGGRSNGGRGGRTNGGKGGRSNGGYGMFNRQSDGQTDGNTFTFDMQDDVFEGI
ncbi:MAG: hypothetical protein ACOYI8_03780 [Christensenellales bacterium]|jgi:hypothetical protein